MGDTLKAIRKQKAISQQALADQLGVVRQTVSKWEKGYSVPDADLLQKIADTLDVSVGELLGTNDAYAVPPSDVNRQLAQMQEQLVIRNQRTGAILKILLWILIAVIAFQLITLVAGIIPFGNQPAPSETQSVMQDSAE